MAVLDSIISFMSEYWWLWVALLPLAYIYIKRKAGKSTMGLTLYDMALVMEIGALMLGWYLIETYIFKENNYFSIALPLLSLLMSAYVYLLLKGSDVYVIETCFEGQQFIDISNNQKITVPHTSHKILIMDRQVYDSKSHVGDLQHELWRGSDRIKFTDYYDEKNGVFHHPRISQIHNITFYAIKGFWVKMRDELPALIDENTLLTWLSNWRLSMKMDVMKRSFDRHLEAIEKQHEHEPFKMPDSLEEIYEKTSKEPMKAPSEPEESPKPKEVNENVQSEPSD